MQVLIVHLEALRTAAPETGARVGGEVPNAAGVTVNVSADYGFSFDRGCLPGDGASGAEDPCRGDRFNDVTHDSELAAFRIVRLRVRDGLNQFEDYLFAEKGTDET